MRKYIALLLAAIIAVFPITAYAAVSVDTHSSEITGTTSPVTSSYTVGASANALVLAVMFYGDYLEPVGLTVTYNGTAMTLIKGLSQSVGGGNSWGGLFGLLAPSTGTHTLSISWTSGPTGLEAALISFNGVSQASFATSFPNSTTVSGTTDPQTITGTSQSGDYTVCLGMNGFTNLNSLNSAPSGTNIYLDSSGDPNSGVSYATGASSVTYTASSGGGATMNYMLFTDILASGGGGVTPHNLLLLGIGQ